MLHLNNSMAELSARLRAIEILDKRTFRELIGPEEGLESPHLAIQGIIPQGDDGVVIAKGTIDSKPVVIISMDGSFQGGGIGEVSGAKIAGALELALTDNENGTTTNVVLLFDTGGVRLQEANHGLLAVSEIHAAVVALRRYVPVIGVIPGKVGCFGGMSITAGLCSTLIITPKGRLTLNGPEVIEQEAGIEELDSRNKSLIWNTIGGEQRYAVGFTDMLVEDDIDRIKDAIKIALNNGNREYRSSKIEFNLNRIKNINPMKPLTPEELRFLWGFENQLSHPVFEDSEKSEPEKSEPEKSDSEKSEPEKSDSEKLEYRAPSEIDETRASRGRTWIRALSGNDEWKNSEISSVLCTDSQLEGQLVRYITVVPNSKSRFPRVKSGEVGIEEGWFIAKYVQEAIKQDENKTPRPIIAIVDVPSQAYGYKEELLGIHQALAGAVDAYASARLAGHPVIAFLAGASMSGAFLAHGYQANCIIALDDPQVLVQAMSKKSAARITKRTLEELDNVALKVPSIASDIHSFEQLGALDYLITGINADNPQSFDIEQVKSYLAKAVLTVEKQPRDLSNRLHSKKAITGRAASIEVRKRLKEEWEN